MPEPILECFLRDPGLLVQQVDVPRRRVVLLALGREEHRRAAFHDKSLQFRAEQRVELDLDTVLAVLEGGAVLPNRPQHFVFHTGFCCSTLLTRCLEELGCCILREPTLLLDFAVAHTTGSPDAALLGRLASCLLGRTWPGTQVAVAKPSNSCNVALEPILKLWPASRALFLYNPPLPAVVSYLMRREWTRQHASNALQRGRCAGTLRLPHRLCELQVESLNDAHVAGLLWLINTCLYLEFVAGPLAERVRSLSSQVLLAHPADALLALARHFGMNVSPVQVQTVVDGDVFRTDAKEPERDFSIARREEQLQRRESKLRAEVEAGLEWVAQISLDLPALDRLPQPLLMG